MIATQLGIRASDTCELTFENFKWESNTIRFIQRKAGYNEDPLINLICMTKFGMIMDGGLFDLIEHRTVIETEAASFAAKRHTAEEIENLGIALEAFAETVNDNQAIGDIANFKLQKLWKLFIIRS